MSFLIFYIWLCLVIFLKWIKNINANLSLVKFYEIMHFKSLTKGILICIIILLLFLHIIIEEGNMTQKEKDKLKLEALRTRLAIRQTAMSCERSLLSYIRTACVFVSLAFTYLKIAAYDQFDTFVIVMFAIGFFFLIFGVVEYFIAKKKTKRIGRHIDKEFLDVDENFMEEDDI